MQSAEQATRVRRGVSAEKLPSRSLRAYWPAAAIAALLVLFGLLSFSAVLGKSATFDEPLHVVGGATHRYLHDFRINPEDPPLFGWWASLPHSAEALPLNRNDAFYEGAAVDINQQWLFVVAALYGRGADAADAYLNTSRFMFVVLGVALGGLIALWAYQIAGSAAAVAATLLFCLDPNILAHSALVKNDVFLSLLMCALGYAIWRLGRDGGRWRHLLLALLVCGLALNVKFSAVLFFPMLGVLLFIRAAMPTPWLIGRKRLLTVVGKILFAAFCVVLALIAAWAITWAVYGFRFSATADHESLNTNAMVRKSVTNILRAEVERRHDAITAAEADHEINNRLQNGNLPLAVRVDLWMQDHMILPEAWLFGFLYTYATTLIRSSFLLGSIRLSGWWYYFPLTIFFKTPTATLAAMLLAPIVALRAFRNVDKSQAPDDDTPAALWTGSRWTLIVLLLPPAVYFITALTTNLNLGLRHILPIYPYLFILLGWIFAQLLTTRRKFARVLGTVIALGLLTESLAAYPNYLAFFNIPSGGSRGGLNLLGDSNLDWGQDLPALARWKLQHPEDRLYLCYFGTANPAAYGLDYVNLPGGYPFARAGDLTATPGVVAISATNVQGIYYTSELKDAYHKALKGEEPFEVLNGTIYLYHWPPR